MRNKFDPLYIDWRKEVLKRDKHKCQMPDCWKTKRLQAHHIYRWADAPYLRYEVSNGITLCSSCHYSIRNNEEYFINLFMSIVEENSK